MMRGYIQKINPNNATGKPYGYINGEDGRSYYFNNRYLPDGYTVTSFYVGDFVEFDFFEGRQGPVAKNILLADPMTMSAIQNNSNELLTNQPKVISEKKRTTNETSQFTKKETMVIDDKVDFDLKQTSKQNKSINNTKDVEINAKSVSDTINAELDYMDALDTVEQEDEYILTDRERYFYPGYAKGLIPEQFSCVLKPGSGEKVIIDKLSKVFYISYVNSHNMGHENNYPFCLIGNTKLIKQFVREKSEFLLIFSHFDKEDWQQNTLKVAAQIRQRKEVAERRPRVNFYILISNAKTLKREIDKVKGGTEAAVIPFKFSEILHSDIQHLRDLIIRRFDEYYFENNMLGEKEAIEEDALLFGDRGKIADAIVQRSVEGSHSGIFGLRRSGKSSVLHAVIRRLQYNQIKYVHIESRSFLESLDSWKTALFDIAREIRKSTLQLEQRDGETNSAFTKRLQLSSTEADYEKRAAQCFVSDVKQYVKNEDTFVIAIDEIELITYNTATSATWRDLDAYKSFWGALRDSCCTLILCGVNSTINESNHIGFNGKECDNPMYERVHLCAEFSKNYLPAFTDDQTKSMINQLGSYSNIAFSNVYTEINSAFGGQPYPIRQFCAFVFDRVKEKRKPHTVYEVSKATFEALHSEFARDEKGLSLCRTILQHINIYRQEYEKLKDFALNPENNRILDPSESTIVDHLEKYGIIEYDRTTSHVAFKIHILQDYIVRTENKNPKDMDNEQRRIYVQNAIAECEKKLKSYIMHYYQYNGTINVGIDVLTGKKNGKVYVKEKDGVSDKFDFSDLFKHEKYIFYFSAIRDVINDYWSTLGKNIQLNGIEKYKFYSLMTDLNKARTDADHYDASDLMLPDDWEIDEITMENFVVAYNTIKNFFRKMSL